MDITHAIMSRKSIRAYKPDPVPKQVLTRVIEAGLRAPSWSNVQSWEIVVLGGDLFQEIKEEFAAKLRAGDRPKPDIPFPKWPRTYVDRRDENGTRLYGHLGIGLDEKDKQLDWYTNMIQFYGAPNGIVVYTDRGVDQWALLNIGLLLENLALAALDHGLGTCIVVAGVSYPEVLRKSLEIPEDKQLVMAVSIGYPDPAARVNEFVSNREPFDSLVTWHGV
jgi:nitroreductase